VTTSENVDEKDFEPYLTGFPRKGRDYVSDAHISDREWCVFSLSKSEDFLCKIGLRVKQANSRWKKKAAQMEAALEISDEDKISSTNVNTDEHEISSKPPVTLTEPFDEEDASILATVVVDLPIAEQPSEIREWLWPCHRYPDVFWISGEREAARYLESYASRDFMTERLN
jgi:hypothetical protein